MKKISIIIMLVLTICIKGHSQSLPQYSFNSSRSYASLFSTDDDYTEYLSIKLLLLLGDNMNNKEKVQLYHRLYEIEHTSLILYRTMEGDTLEFHPLPDPSGQDGTIDFGATLAGNSEGMYDFTNKLWFTAPVTKIDPTLFSEEVTYIKFPATQGLQYKSSPFINVKNLKQMEGKDVVDDRVLISSDGTLIAAAVAGIDVFTIPETVNAIGAGAFRGCTLKSITISANVKSIGASAFDQCENLEAVTILSEEPIHIDESAFSANKKLKYKIYVPKDCYKAYRKANPSIKKRFKK